MIASEQQVREELLAEFRRARVSPSVFCKIHGVNYKTFSAWLKDDAAPAAATEPEPALPLDEQPPAPAQSLPEPVAMPVADPTILTVRALKASRNTRYVYAGLPDGTRINVACNPRKRDRIVGKSIRVQVGEDSAGDKTYTHLP